MGVATLPEIVNAVKVYIPDADTSLIQRAYNFVMQHHSGQTRASGEPYVTHVIEVALLATKLRLDVPSIVTALLHDCVEDTGVTLADVSQEFGEDIARLVDGVTKLNKINFRSRAEQQAENFRKMILAMASDIRVLLIKLCDRTHNMRTLEYLSESRRMRIAQETIDIFAPLAHRLGIHWMKSELEDLSLRYLKPEAYENIKKAVNKKRLERENDIEQVISEIKQMLEKNSLKGSVSGRPKHFFSIFQKMERQGLHFDEVYDLIAFRIIVPTLMECYATLGILHAMWKPIPGKFKDYIAIPKPNGYQSLHTTVIGPHGDRIEIQIRTAEMHEIAEKGIAAHWMYKQADGKVADFKKAGSELAWLRELVESGKILRDSMEFLATVKDGLFSYEVFVFSPKGDVHALAAGSTPIDFAYAVHTQVGHACAGAKVNGRQVPLSYRLKNGDTVEIVTSKTQAPSKDWLSIVVTSKAKQRIRNWLRVEERSRSVIVGREVLSKDLRTIKRSLSELEKKGEIRRITHDMGGGDDPDFVFAEIGYGKVTTKSVIARLFPEESDIEARLAEDESALRKIFKTAAKSSQDKSGIKISGLDDVLFRFAKCCEPLPGEDVVGFITRGRGVTIHSRSCRYILGIDIGRLIPVSWDHSTTPERRIILRVLCTDKMGMLAHIAQSIASHGSSISSAHSETNPDGKAFTTFEINVKDAGQLDSIVRSISGIDGVISVERHGR